MPFKQPSVSPQTDMNHQLNSNSKSKINWASGIGIIFSSSMNILVHYQVLPIEVAFEIVTMSTVIIGFAVMVFRSNFTGKKETAADITEDWDL